jgi:hypothetical protein
MLGPQGDASDGGAPSLVKVIEMRDRFWRLLFQRYDVLWRCGAWLYGRMVDERVLPLPSRQSVFRKFQSVPVARDVTRTVSEQRRIVSPPLMPTRVSTPVRDSTRHLDDVQHELEWKTRFLVRIGAIPPQR